MNLLKNKLFHFCLPLFIFLLALLFRIYNLSWDNYHHLHPDERFLTMVISNIKLPSSLNQYFDTSASPLNPYNYPDYKFFVYGTFPIFTAKLFSHLINYDSYDRFLIFGRLFSALFDSLNVFLLYFITKTIIPRLGSYRKTIIYQNIPGFVYAFTVLPLQLSHFFAVDTFLNFFLLFTFYLLILWLYRRKHIFIILAAITFALALSCKISAILFTPVIIICLIYSLIHQTKPISLLGIVVFFSFITFIVFRLFQPYAFINIISPNPYFLDSLKQLNGILNNRDPYYPPEIQYLNKTPIIYPLITLIFWGFGLPMSLFIILSTIIFFKKNYQTISLSILNNKRTFTTILIVFWIVFIIVYQGLQFTNTVRYYLPIYPFLALLVVIIFNNLSKSKPLFKTLLLFHLIYFFSFFNIYLRPHSRVFASNWIYQNLPTNSSITNEYWDDPLPLELPGRSFSQYRNNMLPLYDPDTIKKWEELDKIFAVTDYIIMSSNRLWRSISNTPSRYPLTSQFYRDLFSDKLNFFHLVTFNSYPGFSLPFINNCYYFGPSDYPGVSNNWFEKKENCFLPGIYLRDDTAEESFTVYDHPQVIIYAKK